MKPKTLLTTLLFFIVALINAQENISNFVKALDSAQNETIKLQVLDSIINKIDKQAYTDTYVTYTKDYISIAEKLEMYDKMIAASVKVFYYINNIQNHKDDALKVVLNAEKYLNKTKDSFLLGSVYLKKGGAYYDIDFKKAAENYAKAILNFGIKDSIYVADSYLFKGQAEAYQGNFLQAIKDYKTASMYYESLGDVEYVILAKSGVATVYGMNKFYEQAEKAEDEVIAYAKENDKADAIVSTLYNKAIHYKELKNPKRQEELLLEAEKINKEANNNDVYSSIYIETSLTKLYVNINQLNKARQHFAIIEGLKEDIVNEKQLMNHYKIAKVAILEGEKKYEEAIALLKEVILFSEEGKSNDHLVDLKEQLAQLYNKTGNTTASYKAFQEYNTLKDSLFNVQKTNALTYYQTLYETEKKEKELVTKNASIEALKEENQAKKRLLGFSIAGLSLLFLCVFLYRNKQHLKKSKIQQEDFSQQLLLSQEEERERISKDLHDGVGQSLLLIKNKVALNTDESTRTMFNNAIEEVRSISRALHPFQLEKLGITKAIKNTIRDVDEHTDIFISSNIDDISNTLTKDQELNLYRIVQETLSNIVKHANAEAAKISVIKESKRILIVIKDNGDGFDFSERYNDFKSLGLKTLRERTKYLKGTMKVDSEKNKGTTFSYIIPIA